MHMAPQVNLAAENGSGVPCTDMQLQLLRVVHMRDGKKREYLLKDVDRSSKTQL